MTTLTPTPTHKAVQEHYGNLARESGSCCGPADGAKQAQNLLYPEELLAGLPSEIASFTAGSGDPITLAELKPGESVLDLGSGGGLDCFLAARQVGESGHVIGVDMTPDMLARARSSAARLKLENVEFREGYLEDLPVDDSSVDVIISNCVINLSPDKPRVLREMFRALKPGGRIAVSDIVTNHPVPERARKDSEDWCGCTSGALPYRTYIAELEKAGFADIRLEPDLEFIEQARQHGDIRVESDRIPSEEEVLEQLRNWENIEANLFVPHKILARKPA